MRDCSEAGVIFTPGSGFRKPEYESHGTQGGPARQSPLSRCQRMTGTAFVGK